MVAIVFDDPVSKLGRPGGPLASRILIFVTLQRKKKNKSVQKCVPVKDCARKHTTRLRE